MATVEKAGPRNGYNVDAMLRTAVTLAALTLAASTGVALAQSPAPSPSPASSVSPSATAVRAARDATREAKALTYGIMARSGGQQFGTVTLERIGTTRSRIRVELATPPESGTSLSMRPGSDCTSPYVANAPHSILLNPFTGRVSETVVDVPLNNIQGSYLVDLQNATARQQSIDACARINSGQP